MILKDFNNYVQNRRYITTSCQEKKTHFYIALYIYIVFYLFVIPKFCLHRFFVFSYIRQPIFDREFLKKNHLLAVNLVLFSVFYFVLLRHCNQLKLLVLFLTSQNELTFCRQLCLLYRFDYGQQKCDKMLRILRPILSHFMPENRKQQLQHSISEHPSKYTEFGLVLRRMQLCLHSWYRLQYHRCCEADCRRKIDAPATIGPDQIQHDNNINHRYNDNSTLFANSTANAN